MIMPVRCFSCGSIIGNAYEKMIEERKKGKSNEEIFDELNIKKYCCKRMILSHVDFIEKINKYKI